MAIAVHCPGCGHPYNLNERFAGRTVKCKQCGGAIAVPALRAPPTAPDSAWLLNEADQLQAVASQAARQQAPLAKLPSGSYKPKKSAGIGRWIAGAASNGLVIVLAISSAYLRYQRRVHRREMAEQRQADQEADGRAVVQRLEVEMAAQRQANAPAAAPSASIRSQNPQSGSFALPSASGQSVVILVHNLPEGLGKVVTDRLGKFSGAAKMSSNSSADKPGEATITLSPVADVRALAGKIDFGTVTEMDEGARRIVVRVDPTKLPEPLPPEVTNPLSPDFYRQNLADLKSWDKDRRKRAVGRLKAAQAKELREEIAAALTEQLRQSEDGWMRTDIIETLPAWADADQLFPTFVALIGDTDDRVARDAVKALGRLKDPRAVAPLLSLADPHRAGEVVDALKQMGAAAEDELLARVDDPDEKVRKIVIKSLGEVGTQKSEATLKKQAGSSDFFIKTEAEEALRKVRQRVGAGR